MRYASIVPAIRTVHGVDVFDYRVSDDADLAPGDIIRFPFRKRTVVGMVDRLSDTSPVADKTMDIGAPTPLLRGGQALADLLESSAERCFTPRPNVLASWLRTVPKRAAPREHMSRRGQGGLPICEVRYAIDRLEATQRLARETTGQVLVLVPWQERAKKLAAALEGPYLHADLADGAAWKAVQGFFTGETRVLVTTRIGAWLALFADHVLIDEPENDDYKQDELTPRLDARWIVGQAARLMPQLGVTAVSTTPRLDGKEIDWPHVPDLDPVLTLETTEGRSRSAVDAVTLSTLGQLEETIAEGRPCLIIHPVRGERARFNCRDCGWLAPCPNCGFALSRLANGAVCRKCGKRPPAPAACGNCGGLDLSRSRAGGDRLATQLTDALGPGVRVIGWNEAWHADIPLGATVVITDIALMAGVVEDIRRKERLIIGWRRLAAMCQAAGADLIVQGDDRLLAQCRPWLAATGLKEAWEREAKERELFGYPPARRMAKLLIDGPHSIADDVYASLLERLPNGWRATPPLPVPYRPAASQPRSCLQISAPLTVTETSFADTLRSFQGTAIIDLDPIGFFS